MESNSLKAKGSETLSVVQTWFLY